MYDGITIDFAGRRLHDFRICLFASPNILIAPIPKFLIVFMYRADNVSGMRDKPV